MQLAKLSKYGAEAVGTFCLVFAGTSAIVCDNHYGHPLGAVGISLVFGLVVLAMIYSIGHISGAHLNPAVSLGFSMAKRLPFKELPCYWLAQFLGGMIASGTVAFLFRGHPSQLGLTQPTGFVSQAFLMEFILSFILMFVIMGVAHDERAEGPLAGVAIGATIAFEAMIGGPISGASMNPIRSLAPALVSGHLEHIWIYLLAPVLGCIAGVFIYTFIRCKPLSNNNSSSCC